MKSGIPYTDSLFCIVQEKKYDWGYHVQETGNNGKMYNKQSFSGGLKQEAWPQHGGSYKTDVNIDGGGTPFKTYRSRQASIKDFPCPVRGCGRNFYHKGNMKRHMKLNHSVLELKNSGFNVSF